MATTSNVQPDPFEQAHIDAQRAIATFLPSLMPPQLQPPPVQQPPRSGALMEAVRAMSLAQHVEMKSARMARGLPPDPPPPPTPEQQFGNQLDAVHTRAIQAAIAAHPETERSRLISEAHDSATKWIGSHNGKVIVHGKVELAHSPQSAQNLAAKIVNQTVEEHDQREQAEAEAAAQQASQPGSPARPAASPTESVESAPGAPGTPQLSGQPLPAATSGVQTIPAYSQPSPDTTTQSAPAAPQTQATPAPNPIPQNPEIVAPGGSGAIQDPGPPPDVTPTEVEKVGTRQPDGHLQTQPKNSIEENQQLAMDAAPELHQSLSVLAAQVPGIQFARLRPQKDEGRLDQKVEDDNKPNTLSDYLGAQVSADSPQAKDQLIALLRKNFKTIEVDDQFLDGRKDKAGYPSANVQVQLANGGTAEIQIVPKEVQDKTNQSHVHYKAGRQAEVDGDNKARDQHWAKAAAIHGEALDAFKARNGIGAPQISGYDVGEPIRIGSRLFAPLKPKEQGNGQPDAANTNPVSAGNQTEAGLQKRNDGSDERGEVSLSGSNARPGEAPAPGVSSGSNDVPTAPAISGGPRQGQLSKGDAVTLKDGSNGRIAYVHPEIGIVRVKLDEGGTRVVSPEEIADNGSTEI